MQGRQHAASGCQGETPQSRASAADGLHHYEGLGWMGGEFEAAIPTRPPTERVGFAIFIIYGSSSRLESRSSTPREVP
jgi:hypothetical protein